MVLNAITALLVLSGCAPEEAGPPEDHQLALRLWGEIRALKDWEAPEGWEGLQESALESDGAHGSYTRVRMNSRAAGTLGGDVIDGGVMVTVDVDEDAATTLRFTAMRKIPGYSEEYGDWFWASYTPKGEVLLSGTPTHSCVYCHMNGTDYVWSAWLTPGDADTGDTGG
jgi:hypothetical protein